MRITAIPEPGLGNFSYVVTSDRGAGSVVVDPLRDASPYPRDTAAVLETHVHADFVSGGPELRRLGAEYFAPAAGRLRHPHSGVRAGETLQVDELTVEVLPSPGHTPEHVSYLVRDTQASGDSPSMALFSGGALMAGGVARTDLISPDLTETLARRLYRALHQEIFSLPDETAVYPTHGGGSFCSATPGNLSIQTTIGAERRHHPAATAADEDDFVEILLSGYGSFPRYYRSLRDRNRVGFPVLGGIPALRSLDIDEFAAVAGREGTVTVDARPYREFADSHIPGSISITLRPQFMIWFGWLVDLDAPVVFVVGEGQSRTELMRQTLLIGHDNIVGEIEGGMRAWIGSGRPISSLELREPSSADASLVVDVRQSDEYRRGHIRGSRHVELGELSAPAAPDGLDPSERIVVTCASGERATTAASLLEARGHQQIAVLDGGVTAWKAKGLPWHRP